MAASRWGGGHLRRALMLTLAWGLTEWLRGHIFTGLPWNLPGYAWMGPDSMAQGAAFFGLYGMTILVLISAVLPAVLAAAGIGRAIVRLVGISERTEERRLPGS